MESTLCDHWPTSSPWTSVAEPLFNSETWRSLEKFVAIERRDRVVYPAKEDVFASFALTPPDSLRAVIIGQDPYHGPGQAHGLCFSVRTGYGLPPSLRNVFAELESDLGIPSSDDGDLSDWARSGVLLLNSVLTVRAGQPGSHKGRGWEWFTDQVIIAASNLPQPIAFLLWGKPAQSKSVLLADRHLQIKSAHPSPLSSWRGFMGSRPFSQTNQWLVAQKSKPVDWARSSIQDQN